MFYLSLCGVIVLFRLWSGDYLIHVSSWLFDFGCALVVASVFIVLLYRDSTITECRVKVCRL